MGAKGLLLTLIGRVVLWGSRLAGNKVVVGWHEESERSRIAAQELIAWVHRRACYALHRLICSLKIACLFQRTDFASDQLHQLEQEVMQVSRGEIEDIVLPFVSEHWCDSQEIVVRGCFDVLSQVPNDLQATALCELLDYPTTETTPMVERINRCGDLLFHRAGTAEQRTKMKQHLLLSKDSPNVGVAEAAVQALAKLKDRAHIDELVGAVATARRPEDTCAVLQTLLRELSKHPNQLRRLYISALEQLRTTVKVPEALELIDLWIGQNDQRRYKRVNVAVLVSAREKQSASTVTEGQTVDLSVGGMYAFFRDSLPTRGTLDVGIMPTQGRETIWISDCVVLPGRDSVRQGDTSGVPGGQEHGRAIAFSDSSHPKLREFLENLED